MNTEVSYLQALDMRPDDPALKRQLVTFYFHNHTYNKALPYLDDVVSGFPADPHVHYFAGVCFHRLEEYEKAQQRLETCLELMPHHSPAHLELVMLGLNLKRLHDTKSLPSEFLFRQPPPEFHRLQIEVTTWCNLLCAGCPRTIDVADNRWQNTHMPLDRFKMIIDTLPPSHTLCLQGVGESTLHPDFPEMVSYAASSGKYRFLTLNTNLLARPIEYYRQIKECGLNHISVSVDSLKQDIADACRKGTNVEKLYGRLKELCALYTPLPLSVTIVASKRNLHDIPNTLRMLNRLGKIEVGIQALIIYDAEKGDDGNLQVALDESDMNILREHIAVPYGNLKVTFAQDGGQKSMSRCERPFLSPYVTAGSYLTPCCTIEDPAILGHTQIDGRPFAEIWKLPHIQAWLKQYALNSHAICNGCCFFTG